ncbi:uncharacterized protein LOC134699325 [Mytilus trossulus]|uniref:uncharacterized protein LOC134699325 n=1 Tax=Mytilus trossulus TaxID=6551 RepID=UPI003005ACFD
MDETLKTKKFTSCGLPPDNSQGENGNSTIVHTKSYFTGHLVYSFDIEIETVCDPSFCFGLRCDKCVTDHTTTLYSKTDTSIPFSDSTIYIGPDETTAPLSINITSGHITATSPIITTVNQSVLEAGSDEIIAMISSVVGFVFLVGILLSIAYKYKSKNQLRNEQTIQATEQPPPSIWLHSPAVNDQECLENRTQFNVSNNKIDQAKLTQEGALLEEHQQYEKKKPSLENESKQGDNQIFLTDHDKKKRKKHKKQKSDTKKEKLKKRGKKLKDKNSSEHSSFKIDMDEKQTSPHLNGRSAIENTSSVNKETQDKSSAYGIEQQNNKGYPDINDVKDKSHIPATTLFTYKTLQPFSNQPSHSSYQVLNVDSPPFIPTSSPEIVQTSYVAPSLPQSNDAARILTETSQIATSIPTSSYAVSSAISSNHRLPKLTLPTFNGNILEWPSFWDSYESAVHYNPTLTDVQKFNYLNAQLENEAAQTIAGFSLTNANYAEAVNVLIERFGQTHKITQAHLQALLDITPPRDDLISLRMFYDKMESLVRGLESLGQTQDSYGNLLVPIIINKLPGEIRKHLAREHGTTS